METYHSKIVILGSSAVGKSCVMSRFVDNVFIDTQESTIGAAFLTKTLELEKGVIRMELWDTAGQERYRALAPMYYRGAAAAVIMYDITDEYSYESAKRWMNELESRCDNIIMVLVGNKIDLEPRREVNAGVAKQYAKNHDALYFETSAKTGVGIEEVFQTIAEMIPKKSTVRRKLRIMESKSVGFYPRCW